jgi:hypothetical protein
LLPPELNPGLTPQGLADKPVRKRGVITT